MKQSAFCFVICQVGAEPVLKKEVAREYPHFKFSFSRPGFVTFKNTKKGVDAPLSPDFELQLVFGRAYGLSLGRIGIKELSYEQRIQAAVEAAFEIAKEEKKRLRLHVWARDRYLPGDEPRGFSYTAFKKRVREDLLKAAPKDLFLEEEKPEVGDSVLDIVGIEDDEWWCGWHRHSVAHSSFAGGREELVLPDDAPSRAYTKLEEVVHWAKIPLRSGDRAVEIGSAPGGACYYLLKQGVSVVGIDPGEMAPVVMAYQGNNKDPWFKHIPRSIAMVPRSSIPRELHWVLLDMNVVPNVSLRAVKHVVEAFPDSLLGVILTIKMNRWILADIIPQMIEQVKAMGMVKVRAAQLSYHRQEITIVGFTRKGNSRRS